MALMARVVLVLSTRLIREGHRAAIATGKTNHENEGHEGHGPICVHAPESGAAWLKRAHRFGGSACSCRPSPRCGAAQPRRARLGRAACSATLVMTSSC